MQVYTEQHERPEHDRRETLENVARDVPCHQVSVSTGHDQADCQIDHPDDAYPTSAHASHDRFD
jgi:hypothetical protein